MTEENDEEHVCQHCGEEDAIVKILRTGIRVGKDCLHSVLNRDRDVCQHCKEGDAVVTILKTGLSICKACLPKVLAAL